MRVQMSTTKSHNINITAIIIVVCGVLWDHNILTAIHDKPFTPPHPIRPLLPHLSHLLTQQSTSTQPPTRANSKAVLYYPTALGDAPFNGVRLNGTEETNLKATEDSNASQESSA